ncbi:hypothetical protein RB595_010347 [Gaeumannomyces hyphopodioides]
MGALLESNAECAPTIIFSYFHIARLWGVYSISKLLTVLAGVGALTTAAKLVYNFFLHPARRFPGPLLARCTRAYCRYYRSTGQLENKREELHEKYGDVLVIAPDELSFSGSRALGDIYGLQTKRLPSERFGFAKRRNHEDVGRMPSDARRHGGKDTHVCLDAMGGENLGASADRSRICSVLSHAFSDSALGAQEGRMAVHADRLVARLRGLRGAPADVARLLHDCVRDMASELSSGRGAGTAGRGGWSPEARERMESAGAGAEPFHLSAKVVLMIDAGSETAASVLAGCLFYLTSHSHTLKRLTEEIRGSYSREADMGTNSLAHLPYLAAVIEESLRKLPPDTGMASSVTPRGGATIDGHWVPGSLTVAASQRAVYRSARNFADPDGFHPERWLGGDPRFERDKTAGFHPFSTGPRSCPGKNLAYAEMKVILSRLVRNFDMQLGAGSANGGATEKNFFVRGKPGLLVVFREREGAV